MQRLKRPNPHIFEDNQNKSLSNLSFNNQNNVQGDPKSLMLRKMRFLFLIISHIAIKKINIAFRNIKYKPLYKIQSKKRLVQVFLSLVRRSQSLNKFEAFRVLKRNSIMKQNKQIVQLQVKIYKARLSMVKILNIMWKNKQKKYIEMAFIKIKTFSKQILLQSNQRFRKGIRNLIFVKNKVIRRYFNHVNASRYLIQRRFKVSTIAKVLKQYHFRSLKIGIDKLRRNLYKQRQSSVSSQIKMIESRIQTSQDEQLKSLKQRQQQLQKSIVQVRKQKQSISQAYQFQIKQAESKNIQIQSQIKQLTSENEQLKKQIKQIDLRLKENYTMDEINQMFYNNLLLYINKNKNKQLVKSEMLEALRSPLIPVNISIDKLIQENQVLKDLLSEYVLMYGQISLQEKPLQIPYEYLVKQNETMYKMLLTLLPQLQYDKAQINNLRESLQSVQKVVNEYRK